MNNQDIPVCSAYPEAHSWLHSSDPSYKSSRVLILFVPVSELTPLPFNMTIPIFQMKLIKIIN